MTSVKVSIGLIALFGAIVCILTLTATAQVEPISSESQAAMEKRIQQLETRLERMEDRAAIEKLTRAFNYYGDHGLWGNVVELFADDSRVEISGRGAYHGKKGVERLFLKAIGKGKIGLPDGMMANHMTIQGIVDVAADGKTAKGRWREFSTYGFHENERALWGAGTLAIEYVKEEGIWKFKDLQFFVNFMADYNDGWGKAPRYGSTLSQEYPPDDPPLEYDRYPGRYVVPFHYPNPVSGKVWTLEDTERHSTKGMSPEPSSNVIQD